VKKKGNPAATVYANQRDIFIVYSIPLTRSEEMKERDISLLMDELQRIKKEKESRQMTAIEACVARMVAMVNEYNQETEDAD